MRKVLLFLTLFLTTAMGVKAAQTTWSDGTNTIKYDVTDREVVIEVGNEGALAAFFAATDDVAVTGQNAIQNATPTKLKIKKMGDGTGALSSLDLNALNTNDFSGLATFTELDLSGATIGVNNIAGSSMKLSGLQYLILPNGVSGADMWNTLANSTNNFKANHPNLKMAASVTNAQNEKLPTWNNFGTQNRSRTETTIDTKRLALYSWVENSVDGFKSGHNDLFNNIDKLDMAGAYGNQDLVKNNNKVFTSNKLHYFDFTGATFSNDVSLSYTTKEYPQYNETFSNGNMGGGSAITTVNTNSFYYLNQYVQSVYTCALPSGNTDIPAGMFSYSDATRIGLLDITIPEGYTSIGAEAFWNTAITSLGLPSTMQSVGSGAFRKCQNLVDVEMKASNTTCTFGDKSFMFCTALKHFTMAEGAANIADQMFEQCHQLEFIRIPSTCKYIGNRAFYLNMSLHSVTIPDGVERIEHQAFYLSGLTDIYLTATQPSHLPLIYAVNSFNYDANSSFSRKDIIGENTPALANEPKAKSEIGHTPSSVVPSWYQEALSNGGYLGSGRCLVNLHYPDELSNFINAVSYNDGTYVTPDLSGHNKLSGHTSISDAYSFTDMEGHKWPSQTTPNGNDADYRIRFDAGNVTGQNIYGWRQFALSSGGVKNFKKAFDDTWYTLCFPWNLTDTQVFEAFNQKCEVVEFVGAEIIANQNVEDEYDMVLHFDEVTATHYMDEANNRYNRYDDGTYTITDPVTVVFKKYRYVLLDENGNETSTEVTLNTNAAMGSTDNVLYYQIENVLMLAGVPHMVHPAGVEYQGQPTECVLAGIKPLASTNEQLANLENAGSVTKAATTRTNPENTYGTATPFVNPETNAGGSYTFRGYLGRPDGVTDYNYVNDKSTIPMYAYFLAVKSGEKYPKYYREIGDGSNKWNTYTAVIVPDKGAIDNIEALDGMKKSSSANIAFGEWEQVEATAIEQIIADAQKRGEEVREIHMNVVYNINGQVVRTDGQIEGLPKGLYIVSGKKYLVK